MMTFFWPLLVYPIGPFALAFWLTIGELDLEGRRFWLHTLRKAMVLIGLTVIVMTGIVVGELLSDGCATPPVGWHGCMAEYLIKYMAMVGVVVVAAYFAAAWISRIVYRMLPPSL